jgi:hypothetical protein
MKSYPSTRCLLFGAPTTYFRVVSRKMKRSKESINVATSEKINEADQRHNIKEIKGADQRCNIRADQRSQ